MTDGLTSVKARIAEIERQFATQKALQKQTTAPSTSAGSTGQAADSFAGVLQRVSSGNKAVDLKAYGNGRIPESALVSIGGKEKLAAPAAQSFNRMQADAKAAGVSFSVNDSYRSYDEQVQMAKTKGLYSQGGLAAQPGTSDHGRGLSLDLQLDAKSQSWMKANAGRYGFVNDVKGESWHWTYKGP